jgi:hypothetical protein
MTIEIDVPLPEAPHERVGFMGLEHEVPIIPHEMEPVKGVRHEWSVNVPFVIYPAGVPIPETDWMSLCKEGDRIVVVDSGYPWIALGAAKHGYVYGALSQEGITGFRNPEDNIHIQLDETRHVKQFEFKTISYYQELLAWMMAEMLPEEVQEEAIHITGSNGYKDVGEDRIHRIVSREDMKMLPNVVGIQPAPPSPLYPSGLLEVEQKIPTYIPPAEFLHSLN